ncbi:MAG: 50S ribosomal protein L9 [Deltaproteobacteria bacterium]
MKVILQQDVKGQGKKGQMIEVSDGYARNFLLPKKLAIEANSNNVNLLNQKKQAEADKKNKELAQAKMLAEKINNTTVAIKAKSGENGKLFGSITAKDIADHLKTQAGIDLDKRKISLDDSIKSLGALEVDVRLYEGVHSKLKVKIEQLTP